MEKMKKGNWSKGWIIFFSAAIVLLMAFFAAKFLAHRNESAARTQAQAQASSISIAYITDIHADKADTKKDVGNNVIYPSNYRKCLEEVLAQKTDLVIATGDNTEKGKPSYYQDLKSLTNGRNVIWVKGNHDSSDFQILSAKNYYYVDFQNWRIIVLDSMEQFGSSTGILDDTQINFLKDSLNTDKNMIVAMHHPPFFYNSRENIYTRDKIALYDSFFSALTPNVKYVLTGHWHHQIEAEINGVQYLTEKALTQDGICNYKIINLPK
jgi:Icc protein